MTAAIFSGLPFSPPVSPTLSITSIPDTTCPKMPVNYVLMLSAKIMRNCEAT